MCAVADHHVGDFEKIILRVNADQSKVELRDVARIELGGENSNTESRQDEMPAPRFSLNSPFKLAWPPCLARGLSQLRFTICDLSSSPC